jgi:DNA-binding protein HU-beta
LTKEWEKGITVHKGKDMQIIDASPYQSVRRYDILVIINRRKLFMNKTELIAAIAEQAEISKKDSEKALKAFVDVVTEELKKGEKVQLVGFGTFEVSERAAREGRNPQTGKTMKIDACKAPKFKAGKALKDAIN